MRVKVCSQSLIGAPIDFSCKVFSDHSAHEQSIVSLSDRVAIDTLLHLNQTIDRRVHAG